VVQSAVAKKKAEASIGEVGLMVFTNCVSNKRNPCPVLLAMPPSAVGSQPSGKSLIDFRVGERFGLAVVPAKAAEGGQMPREVLLQVHTESVFAGDVPGMSGDFWNGGEACFEVGNGLTIDPHVGIIGVGQ